MPDLYEVIQKRNLKNILFTVLNVSKNKYFEKFKLKACRQEFFGNMQGIVKVNLQNFCKFFVVFFLKL